MKVAFIDPQDCTAGNDGQVKISNSIFVVLTVIFAGSFVAAYAPASTNGGKYAQEVTNYDNQLGAVVLKQALSHWNDIAIENSTLVMSEYTRNATLQWKAL